MVRRTKGMDHRWLFVSGDPRVRLSFAAVPDSDVAAHARREENVKGDSTSLPRRLHH